MSSNRGGRGGFRGGYRGGYRSGFSNFNSDGLRPSTSHELDEPYYGPGPSNPRRDVRDQQRARPAQRPDYGNFDYNQERPRKHSFINMTSFAKYQLCGLDLYRFV